MPTITLKRGSTLAILATPKSDGTPVVLDNTYTVAAAIVLETSEGTGTDLGATIDGAGKIAIDFDTVDLTAGTYKADIRITNPTGDEEWTEEITIIIREPVTKPSTRS